MGTPSHITTDTILDDGWCLYFHDPNDQNWDKDATTLLTTIQSVEDFVTLAKEMKDMWQYGMFFLMREHIQPEWEDPHCREGGCISYKINKCDVSKAWFELCAKVLGECLLKNPNQTPEESPICGVSITPKRTYCILRIWIAQPSWSNMQLYDLVVPPYSTVMYRDHQAS